MNQRIPKLFIALMVALASSACQKQEDSKPQESQPVASTDTNELQAIVTDFNQLPGCEHKIYWGQTPDKNGYFQNSTGCAPKDMNEFLAYARASEDLQKRIAIALANKSLSEAESRALENMDRRLRGYPNYQATQITAGLEKISELFSRPDFPVAMVVSGSQSMGDIDDQGQIKLDDFVSPEMTAVLEALPKTLKDTFWYEMKYENLEVGGGIKFSQIMDLNYNFKHIVAPLERDLEASYPGKRVQVQTLSIVDQGPPSKAFFKTMINLRDFLVSQEIQEIQFDELKVYIYAPGNSSAPEFNIVSKGKQLVVDMNSKFYFPYSVDQMKWAFEKSQRH